MEMLAVSVAKEVSQVGKGVWRLQVVVWVPERGFWTGPWAL